MSFCFLKKLEKNSDFLRITYIDNYFLKGIIMYKKVKSHRMYFLVLMSAPLIMTVVLYIFFFVTENKDVTVVAPDNNYNPVTFENFVKVKVSQKDGMSPSEVKGFLKSPDEILDSHIEDLDTKLDIWHDVAGASVGSHIKVHFAQGRAISKAIEGLKLKRENQITLNRLKKLKKGMKPDKVLKILGRPNGYSETILLGASFMCWDYTSGVKGKLGANCSVRFKNNKVYKVDNAVMY